VPLILLIFHSAAGGSLELKRNENASISDLQKPVRGSNGEGRADAGGFG
jgi:hypothetical protein